MARRSSTCVLLLVLCSWSGRGGAAPCFFPQEYHGSYVVQYPSVSGGQSSRFSEVTVIVDAIPAWGTCERRLGHNVVLRDRTKTTDCVRCFRLQLHSVNVLHVHTEGLDKCYASEEDAVASCPGEHNLHRQQEILLYRKPGAESVLQQVFCPINGRYRFTYSMDSHGHQCSEPVSELSNCPYGFILTAKFRQCSFGEREVSFQCLGDWQGSDGREYLALLDPSPMPVAGASGGPRYRCAVYGEEEGGGIVVSVSPDSTCASLRNSSSPQHEQFRLIPVVPPSWPASVQKSHCRFPDWAEGEWQQISVDGDTLTYTDPHNFQSYTMRCLQNKFGDEHRGSYLVYARTQCGDETYNCLTMNYRGKLAMEFQIGQHPSLHFNQSLCNSDQQQFASRSWITQGKVKSARRSSCPIAGEYTGLIPDATGLCAKVSSDCGNPETMFYSVSNCDAKDEIYEEREYRCLGEWDEDGVLYTFTQRKDLHGFQCFVGKIVDDQDVYIKEAGDNCIRGMDPTKFGMKMTKQRSCASQTAADMPQLHRELTTAAAITTDRYKLQSSSALTTAATVPFTTRTTKPWKPITASPTSHSSTAASTVHAVNVLTTTVPLVLVQLLLSAVG